MHPSEEYQNESALRSFGNFLWIFIVSRKATVKKKCVISTAQGGRCACLVSNITLQEEGDFRLRVLVASNNKVFGFDL